MQTELNVGNAYGYLTIKEEDDKFYWSVENWSGHYWVEISKELYDCLMKNNEAE
ncbi:hypothetical protein VPHK435_0003 [Vibrio phage K435]